MTKHNSSHFTLQSANVLQGFQRVDNLAMLVFRLSLLMMLIIQPACATATSTIDNFPQIKDDFADYQAEVQDWLQSRSLPNRNQTEVQLNAPFEWQADPNVPYQGRYLLFHGLNDSPYVWRGFASELVKRGFDVRAILFAGHGTTPRDMLYVEWEQWWQAANAHLKNWQEPGIPMHLGGFSMGAVIATWLALEEPSIKSLLLVSPAYESQLNHYLRWSGIYAKFKPWVFGGMILEDNPMKYNSIPVNSGWQYYQLTQALKEQWGRHNSIDIPVFMVTSVNDSVVNVNYTQQLFNRRFTHDQRLLVIYDPNCKASGEQDSNDAGEDILCVDDQTNAFTLQGRSVLPNKILRPSSYPDLRILNQSHLGLMYPPEDPLFGIDGSVLVCNGNEYPIFMACMRSREHWYGAQHTPSPDGVAVARTTYNPDWSNLMNLLDRTLYSELRN